MDSPLPPECELVISYLKNLREIHRVCLAKEIDPDYEVILANFEDNFNYLYDNFDLNMTYKVHVIIHHFKTYFEMTNTTMRVTNGEFVETLHNSLRIHEENHGFKVVRKLGSATHLRKAKQSLVMFNSKRAGFSPPKDLTLRRKSSPHPNSSPNLH